MSEKFAPKISREKLENYEDSWDYIYKILDPYFDYMDENGRKSFYENANYFQKNLFNYRDFDRQVGNGGFEQMIFNRYYFEIFSDSFSSFLKETGLSRSAEIIEKAKKIFYEKDYEKLLNTMNFDDFPSIYGKMPEFRALNLEYYEIDRVETDIMADFVRKNISNFIEVID